MNRIFKTDHFFEKFEENARQNLSDELKYFYKSQKFAGLFYFNFSVLAILFLLSLTRYFTGIMRDKPVLQIGLFTIALSVAIIFFLFRLSKQAGTTVIPKLYQKKIFANKQSYSNLQWQYFLLGSAVLATSFFPISS